jgi:hypothetical protein
VKPLSVRGGDDEFGDLVRPADHFFIKVDPYLRVGRCWARALTGDDPAAAG